MNKTEKSTSISSFEAKTRRSSRRTNTQTYTPFLVRTSSCQLSPFDTSLPCRKFRSKLSFRSSERGRLVHVQGGSHSNIFITTRVTLESSRAGDPTNPLFPPTILTSRWEVYTIIKSTMLVCQTVGPDPEALLPDSTSSSHPKGRTCVEDTWRRGRS